MKNRTQIFVLTVFLLGMVTSTYYTFLKEEKTDMKERNIEQGKNLILNNIGNIVKPNEDVIEIEQPFLYENSDNLYYSQKYMLNIKNPSFIMFSAYSLDTITDFLLSYRINNNSEWSNWKELTLNVHDYTPKRKVFELINLFNSIDSVQFKSNKAVSSKVYFRFFVSK